MPDSSAKIKIPGLGAKASQSSGKSSGQPSAAAQRPTPHVHSGKATPASTTARTPNNARTPSHASDQHSTNSSGSNRSTRRLKAAHPTREKRSSLLPGGVWFWCLVGLAIGLGGWLGGRHYLRHMLATRLTASQNETTALQSIDALLRLDANATVDVSRGLAHPEFMVANAAFRAIGGQLDAWSELDPADRLLRMQQIVQELDRLPTEVDQDHRILINGLASRIYADTLSNRESGAANVLEICRRVMSRTDGSVQTTRIASTATMAPNASNLPATSPTSFALPTQDNATAESPDEVVDNQEALLNSPVPPPLPPIESSSSSTIQGEDSSRTSMRLSDGPSDPAHAAADSIASRANSMPRLQSTDGVNRQAALGGGRATVQLTSSPSSGANKPVNGSNGSSRLSDEVGELAQPETTHLANDSSSRSLIIPQSVEPIPEAAKSSESSAPMTLAGIEALTIDQLVRLLSSLQPRVSQAAALTLRNRGMSEQHLNLAIQLANGTVEQRQELLVQLVEREDLNPRPWLIWMASDGQDEVRQIAVSLLQPLADEDVRRQLRLLLNKERDENVAQTIRQVLVRPE